MNTNRLHISLNVSNIEASVSFYSKLFGSEPVKLKEDYAKFESETPRMNLSLNLSNQALGKGALSHLGFQVESQEDLRAWQDRLQKTGLVVDPEEGVCCYAKQSKFWLADPDNNAWEVYLVEADSESIGSSKVSLAGACC